MNIPVYGQQMRNLGADLQMLKVTASTIPSMRVQIAEGSALINRQLVEYAGGTIGPIAIPTINSYIVVVGLKGANPVVLYGNTATNNPPIPDLPADVLPLAAIILKSTDTAISQDMIQDIRPLFSSTTFIEDHQALINRDAEDAHPISSITGLQAALDGKLTAKDLEEQFNNKANFNGTRAEKFTLNSESTGTPVSDIVIEFKRGSLPSAAIRFNETKDILEFSDGDGEWHPFNTVLELDPFNEEAYYTKAQVDSFLAQIKKNVLLKADSSRVESIAAQLANVASLDYVNNQFQNIYSKQDMDNIVREVRLALTTITGKADKTDVYSKTEADEILAAAKDELNARIDEIAGQTGDITNKVNEIVEPKLAELADTINTKAEEFDGKLNAQKDALVATIDAKAAEVTAQTDGKISVLTNTVNAMGERVDNARDAAIAMVKEHCGMLDAKLDGIQKEAEGIHNDLVGRMNTAEETVRGFDTRVTTIENDLEDLKHKVDADKDELTQGIADVKGELNSKIDETVNNINTRFEETSNDFNSKIDIINTTIEQKVNELNQNITNAKDELNHTIDEAKSEASATHTDINNTIDTVKNDLNTAITNLDGAYKAADEAIYAKLEEEYININDNLVIKANAADVYTKAEVDQKISEIDLSDKTYSKEEIDSKLESKADIADVYRYTAAQIELAIEPKQDKLGFTPENAANKNVANGYAGLDVNGKIAINQLPDVAKQPTYVVANEAAKDALTNLVAGAKAYVIDTKKSYIYDGSSWIMTADADWENINIDFNNIINTPTTIAGYGITDGYTKDEVDAKLADKANKDHTHTISEVQTDSEHMFISAAKLAEIDNKANLSQVYTQDVIDSKFIDNLTFEQTMNGYTNTEGMNTALASKANSSDVYAKSDVDSLLNDKADKSDTYTKAEVDALVNNAIANVLQQVQDQINQLNS